MSKRGLLWLLTLLALTALAAPTFASARTAHRRFVSVSVKRELGSVRATIRLQAVPDLHFSVKLNGHDVTSQFPPRLGLTRATLLGADDGLRHGHNVLTVTAVRGDGRSGHATATFDVPTSEPLVGAGHDVNAFASQSVKLAGIVTGLGRGGAKPSYLWKVVLAPNGSDAKLTAPHSLHSRFTPDRPGIYRLRLIVRVGGRSAVDELVLTDTPSYPPIGAAVNTMADNGAAIQVGSNVQSFNPYPCNALNVMVVDRDTLAVAYASTLGGGVNSATSLLSTISTMISEDKLDAHPYVIVSDTLQNPNTNCVAVNNAWNNVIKQIGGTALPSGVQANGGWSIVGGYKDPQGTAWQNNGTNEPDDILQGSISGYLQNDYVGAFNFVPAQRIKVDLDAPGAPAGQNTIKVGSTTYTSGALSCSNGGGFQVVTLNAVTLQELSSKTETTNGCGSSQDTTNEQALIQYLNGVAQSPSSNVNKALVMIQSIGSPYDSSTSSTWQQLDTAVSSVGGTQTVLGNDTSSYSLIGDVGISSFPFAEGSGTATPNNPAHVTAVLRREPPYVYEPELSSGTGGFGFDLPALAYQPSQQFTDTPGERKALAYISSSKVLGLPVPTPNTAQDFCYIPPQGQLDVRYAYCDPNLKSEWLGSQFANDLNNVKWNSSLGFSQQDLTNVVNQLLPQTGHGEFAEVSQVWTAIDDLSAATSTRGTTALSIVNAEATTIHQVLANRFVSDAKGHWFDVIANSLNLLGALYPNETDLAEPVNLLAAGLYLAEDAAATDGEETLGKFSVSAADFEEELSTAYQNAGAGLNHLLGLIVTDPGKLQSFYQNSANYTYQPTLQSNRAFRLGAAAFGWQSLLPSAYQLDLLPRHIQNDGVTNAQDYICSYNAGRRYGPYGPFPNSPLSGQLLNSQLYVLTKVGDPLPNGQDENTPSTPPKALTDPLFKPYQSSNGVITQFGLYKPWFYRDAYPPSSVVTVHGC